MSDESLAEIGFAPADIAARQAFLNSEAAGDLVSTYGRQWAEEMVRSAMGPPDSLLLLADVAVSRQIAVFDGLPRMILREIREWELWTAEQLVRIDAVSSDWERIAEAVEGAMGDGDHLRILGLAFAMQARSVVEACREDEFDPVLELKRLADLLPVERRASISQTAKMITSGTPHDLPWGPSLHRSPSKSRGCLGGAPAAVLVMCLVLTARRPSDCRRVRVSSATLDARSFSRSVLFMGEQKR